LSELNTEEKLAQSSMLLSSEMKSWWVLTILKPFERLFLKLSLKPDHITLLATVMTLPIAICLSQGFFLLSGWLTLLVGSLDILDGKLARHLGLDSIRGEFLDSVMDRIQDFFILVGLLIYFRQDMMPWVILVVLGSSQLIPYIKAKAELLGGDLKRVGLMQRPERFFTLAVGLLFDGAFESARVFLASFEGVPEHIILKGVLWLLAAASVFTVYRRLAVGLDQLGLEAKK